MRSNSQHPWLKRANSNNGSPSREFANYFRGPRLWASNGLWNAYQEWRRKAQEEEFARFEDYFIKNREEARKEMEKWTCPLPNGVKGEPYACSFRLPDCVPYYIFNGLKPLGLSAAYDTKDNRLCSITGVPSRTGEFRISLVYGWHGHRRGIPPLERELILTIKPAQPKFWRDIPTSRHLEFYKKDQETALISCSGRIAAAASRRGCAHAHVGLPRDDDFALDCVNGWLILAVAHGSGSALLSRRGSALACQIATRCCHEQLEKRSQFDDLFESMGEDTESCLAKARIQAASLLEKSLFEARRAIREEAAKLNRELKQFASTLQMALCKKYPAGWIIIAIQIGNGAIAMINAAGQVTLLAGPDKRNNTEDAVYITAKSVLAGQELQRELRIELVESLEAVAVVGAGLAEARFADPSALRDADSWKGFFTEILPLLETEKPDAVLLDWLDFPSCGNNDDRTLAIMG